LRDTHLPEHLAHIKSWGDRFVVYCTLAPWILTPASDAPHGLNIAPTSATQLYIACMQASGCSSAQPQATRAGAALPSQWLAQPCPATSNTSCDEPPPTSETLVYSYIAPPPQTTKQVEVEQILPRSTPNSALQMIWRRAYLELGYCEAQCQAILKLGLVFTGLFARL
jgi:hypothetical protein